ncbi:EG45-like domain containing protein [Canna indica]|uniref:EG45-like domain containing protein n=1 Tax=Canna indica TaxID=4628 RepID=A0AAQ3KV16_9LILI|nr:EG45-like domain containing protein [Canna indica]
MAKSLLVAMAMAMMALHASFVAAVPGTASFSTPSGLPSACFGPVDPGVFLAAASGEIWNNGSACGRRYMVTCTGPANAGETNPCKGTSVNVTIVDYCPACQATFDLSLDAFAVIADPNAGRINIEYTQV